MPPLTDQTEQPGQPDQPDQLEPGVVPLRDMNWKLALGPTLIQAGLEERWIEPDDPDIIELENELLIAIALGSIPEAALGKLGVNLGRLITWLRVAGISELAIRDTANIQDQNAPTIAGHTPDGTALGGLLKGSFVPKSTSAIKRLSTKTTIVNRCPGIEINIDGNRLAETINEKYPTGIRSAEGWAAELNKEIAPTIRRKGLRTLLTPTIIDASLDLFLIAAWTFIVKSPLAAGIVLEVLHKFVDAKKVKPDREDLGLDHYPTNLQFGGMYFDRAINLAIRTSIGNCDIFSAIKPAKK